MNKANECTCPSGDGSLVHPCPAHPAVEQAGTNVGHGHVFPRADGVKMRCGGPALCSECAADAYRARAALAQPSPAGEYGDAYQGAREDIAIWKRRALEAEQALRQAHNGQTFMGEPLVQPYEAPREKVNALFKVLGFSGTASVGDILDAALERLQAQPSPAQAEAERPEGPTEDELEAAGLGYPLHKEEAVKLWYSGFRSEVITVLEAWEAIGHDIGMNPDKGELLDSLRYMLEKCEAHDAALAEVEALRAELQSQRERNTELIFKLGSATNGWGRCEKERDAALARVAELEKQEPVATIAKVPGEDWNGLHFYRDLQGMQPGMKLYAAPVAQAPRSDHSELRRIAVALKNPLLSGDEASDLMVRYEALTMPDHIIALIDSQALHSVPEASEQEKEQGWTLDYRFVERVTDLAASRTEYTTSMEATEQVLLAARELLAAAPGKEGNDD
ncbi:hypothetical protein [Pseudomonas aeruginosa]|uniref:hypothetical protein n=1 Tax=Pseudomonas aeruginosa TaxID=287 RepID=UPI0015CB49F2|nr:hypothetical protein [Pseudomonas aeruginosa]